MNSTNIPVGGSQTPILHPTPIIPFISDKQLSLLLPLVIYWVYSGFFHLISVYKVSYFEKYRIHYAYEAETKNKVSMSEVIKGVLIQQFLQTLLGLLVVVAEDEDVLVDDAYELKIYHQNFNTLASQFGLNRQLAPFQHMIVSSAYWYIIPTMKFAIAMLIFDTWQYFIHRLFHQNSFLYRHIHSRHHLLYVPYAFGALYNHPVEGFVLDSVGASIAFKLSGLTTRGGMLFFSFATLKTVDDHCGYDLPFDPIQIIFGNNSAYHDIHHQNYGIKMNFSQPFFTIWDRILGTYMAHPPTDKKKLSSENQDNDNKVETKTNNTINFNHISSKVNDNGNRCIEQDNDDHIRSRDKVESNNRGNSFRYNLRQRKY
ncbi:7313_t:CDS:2 [Ambispora leptoticha]|uniref:7313_t:CDS:1 n=1 Tax=Ambispora leptoticha TaxID=144679 RepID=A0A9N9CV59_9GLOM|nr:7313_t:CDS:2 [Ambispora leptoticha]